MQQCALWHETRLDALAADVQVAGGPKKVGHRLWPSLEPSIAAAKLRACLNPEQAKKRVRRARKLALLSELRELESEEEDEES